MRHSPINPLNPHNHPVRHRYYPHCTEEKTEAPGGKLASSETKHSEASWWALKPSIPAPEAVGGAHPTSRQPGPVGSEGSKFMDLVEEEGVCNTDRWGPREACLGKLFKLASSPILYS